jgi:UDP-N-acetylglucosamine--N-acetylmuramyl-(pentapeptide) pyrophosphoryl-undecaprenol N-acetylglucosamine transferase
MILLTGGGTGGHLSIVKAVASELNSLGLKPLYIGSKNGQDREWFEDSTLFEKSFFLSSSGVVNKRGLGKLKSFFNILKLTNEAKNIIKSNNIKKVFSVGGYSAAPAAFCSILLQKELIIHEQNAKMGRLNQVLSRFAKETISSFDSSSIIKDYPLLDIYFKNARVRENFSTIIFLGGSQGAKVINDFALSLAKELDKRGIKIIHQCGKRDYERVKNEYEKIGVEVDLFAFSSDLALKIKEADFAISRAGASTLWELVATLTPTLFIPYPYAASNHQYFNAKYIVDKKAAFLQTQNKLDSTFILNLSPKIIKSTSQSLQGLIKPNGAKKIAKFLLESRI